MSPNWQDLVRAAISGPDEARRLAAENPAILRDESVAGETALHWLAVENDLNGVRILAELGADVNTLDHSHTSPLIHAVGLGYLEMSRLLLELGADPNVQSTTNETALDCAVTAGHVEIASALLDSGADPTYVTDLGTTIEDALEATTGDKAAMRGLIERRRAQT